MSPDTIVDIQITLTSISLYSGRRPRYEVNVRTAGGYQSETYIILIRSISEIEYSRAARAVDEFEPECEGQSTATRIKRGDGNVLR